MTAITEPDLRTVMTQLMKGVVYQDTQEKVWRQLLPLQARIRDYVSVIGLLVCSTSHLARDSCRFRRYSRTPMPMSDSNRRCS